MLTTQANLPVQSVAELVARAKANPGKLTIASSGNGSAPHLLGELFQMSAGIDLFSKFSDQTKYSRYENRVTGGQLRLGLPFTEEFTLTLRYSLFQQDLEIPNDYKQPYNDCSVPLPGYTQINPAGTPGAGLPNRFFCEGNGEASLAIKESQGKTLTSLAGLTFNYNTLDNVKDPRNGFYAEAKTDFAGLGGDSHYFRATGDARYYRELFEDLLEAPDAVRTTERVIARPVERDVDVRRRDEARRPYIDPEVRP